MRDEEPDFTIEDIIQEVARRLNIEARSPCQRDEFSTREIADATGVSREKVRDCLRTLAQEELLNWRTIQLDYGLGPVNVRVYKLKGPPQEDDPSN